MNIHYILVIAHPDDESMFFLPTLCNVLESQGRVQAKVKVHILCLSNGNYDGLGKIREQELMSAAQVISGRNKWQGTETETDNDSGSKIHVKIVSHSKLQDGPNNEWPEDCVCSVIGNYIQSLKVHDDDGNGEIVLITFDRHGVSGHRNHIDTWKGVMAFVQNSADVDVDGDTDTDANLTHHSVKEVWLLRSISNPIRKYIPFLAWMKFIWMIILQWMGMISMGSACSCSCTLAQTTTHSSATEDTSPSHDNILVYQMLHPRLVWEAMKAHDSQFVWYRRLFVIFSRYSYVNDMIQIKISDSDWVRVSSARDIDMETMGHFKKKTL